MHSRCCRGFAFSCAIRSLHVVDRRPRVGHHQRRRGADQADRLEVGDRVVVHLLQGRVHRVGADVAEHQRMAVRFGPGDVLAGDRAVGAGAVVDEDRLAEQRPELLRR